MYVDRREENTERITYRCSKQRKDKKDAKDFAIS